MTTNINELSNGKEQAHWLYPADSATKQLSKREWESVSLNIL